MGGHDRGNTLFNRTSERHEFDGVETPPVVFEDRQLVVRIRAGVSVPGKVLPRRQQPARVHPARVGRRVAPHLARVLAEGAGVDDGVGGISL